ncbi:hypothetical protein RHMOL_Rhmol11G0067700 [Rhododendron molle]|uniref:Uncharacterized protein n=1 Tax=Rhododendron molle TaxID=49168 RepID=A0ACC0LPH2_RHOML|nr:hypothetical protein RHMOL_Rhmol11G0067700 [Rhododendron molle]
MLGKMWVLFHLSILVYLCMSAIKTLNETYCEDWNDSLTVNLAIMDLVLALREKAPPKPTAESSAAIKAYYERREHSNVLVS